MGIISTQGFTFRLMASGSNGFQQLDTFDDEDIKLSNNITGLFDVGVLPSDFTRQITLPGSKVNNAFFEHVYDISITDPYLFSTNIKVAAYFDFDSIYLSSGYIQLNKINVRANKFIESYDITVYGTLSSFGRDINKYFLTDLTSLAEYNHTSSYNNIINSWSGSLFGGDIVYPLADYGNAYRYTSGQYELFGMDDINGALAVQNFKPAIRVKPVLDAIFSEAGYTYSSSFMNQPFVDDIYLLCNNSLKYPEFSDVDLETYGKIKIGAISGSGMTDVLLPSGSWVTLPWYNVLSDPQGFYNNGAYTVEKRTNITGVLNLNINVSCSQNNMPGTLTANGTWQTRLLETGSSTPVATQAVQSYIFFFDQLQQSRGALSVGINQNYELASEIIYPDVPVGTYYFQVRQSPNYPSSVAALPVVTIDPQSTTKSYLQIKEVSQAADGRILDIPSNMPYGTSGIKQIDFVLGLQKKFNLVIYADKTKRNNFIIETFNDWYKRGQIRDFNKYINLDETIEVVPANNLAVNKLNFGDTLDQDYISQQFSKEANREFGKQYYIDTTNYFSQGSFDVKTTFASDPLIRIAGTGLSGSVAGLTPTITQYQVGYLKSSTKSAGIDTCFSYSYPPYYTMTGTIQPGLIVYVDPYGNTPLTGYRSFVSTNGEATEIDSFTGEIGLGSGYYC
jgi:hypothetical protein